ncbi:unnamed protein product [Larinioides sclopetarius]|uniref:Uncharacterized protein n=1 Tax=Larinioides sclopetarius TaxID=280406 RepID=A0AAV2BYY7_9ARAC
MLKRRSYDYLKREIFVSFEIKLTNRGRIMN